MDNKALSRLWDRQETIENELEELKFRKDELNKMRDEVIIEIKHEQLKRESK